MYVHHVEAELDAVQELAEGGGGDVLLYSTLKPS